MNRKKYMKLNIEDDSISFEDEDIGPIKPGNSFFKWLGKGPPLKVPIADTIYIGAGNQVKIIYNDHKGTIQHQAAQFDQQALKDQFFELCIDKFLTNSVPLSTGSFPAVPPEPIYSRIVALQKRPASGSGKGSSGQRGYLNQTCDLFLPVSFHAQLLDISEGVSTAGCILQKFIKSRGKRPTTYRLFWKASSMETGAVEGWNITRVTDGFQVPDLILDAKEKQLNEELLTGAALEEFQFKKQVTKLIASFLTAGQQHIESTEQMKNPDQPAALQVTKNIHKSTKTQVETIKSAASNLITSEIAANLNPWTGGKATAGGRSSMISRKGSTTMGSIAIAAQTAVTATTMSTLVTSGLPQITPILTSNLAPSGTNNPHSNHHFSEKRPSRRGSFSGIGDEIRNGDQGQNRSNMRENATGGLSPMGLREGKKRSIFEHSTSELNSFFLKGLEKRAQLIGAERSDAIMISSKISHQLSDQMTSSISGNDGLISDEKCSKLMITRISNSALTVPIQYVADIVHWIETMLQINHQLYVHINECVCDFIKDDEGNWFFINLKSFRITPESHGRVRLWHQIATNPSSAAALMERLRPRLSTQERHLKHEAELGILCKLCGLYYIEHSAIDVARDRNNLGYSEEKKDGVTITIVPAYGYSMTCFAAAIVASIYRSYHLPLTRHASYLLNNYSSHQEMHFRSVRQSSEPVPEGKDNSAVVGNGRVDGTSANAKGSGGNSDVVICCYHCCTIYEKHLLLNRRNEVLYALLGITHNKEENSSLSLNKEVPESSYEGIVHTKSTKEGVPPRPKSAPCRKSLPFSPSRSQSNQGRSPFLLNQELKLKERNETIKSKLLQYWRDLTQATPSSSLSNLERCSFHALPRSAQHFRLLTMFHCMVFEDPSEIEDRLCRSYDDSSPLHIHNPQLSDQTSTPLNLSISLYNHCLIYQFGQQEVCIPFTISKETLKKDPSSHSFYLPIQECRIQHVLGKKEDLFQYLKQSKMRCYLLSYDEQRRPKNPNLFSKKSFDLQKSFEERKQERLAAFLLSRSNSSSRLSVPESPSSRKVDNQRDVIMNECDFEFSFHELKGYEKDENVLSTGFAKFDLVIKVKTLHLSTVSFKISFAIQLDAELPSNLNTVRNFAVEDKKIYWPSADYYPTQSALPSTWLSMLLIPSTAFLSAATLDEVEQKVAVEEEESNDVNSPGIFSNPSPHSLHKKKGKEEDGDEKRNKLMSGRRSSVAVKSTLIQNNPSLRRSSQMISALSALSAPQLPNTSTETNSNGDLSSLSILPADKREKRSFMINKVTDAILLKEHEFVISQKTPLPSTVGLDNLHTTLTVTPSTSLHPHSLQKIPLPDPNESERKETQRIREFSSHYFSQSELRAKAVNITDGLAQNNSNSPTEKETNSNTGGRGSLVAGRRSLILNELYSAINQEKQLPTNTVRSNKDLMNNDGEREKESKTNRLTPAQILQNDEGYQRLIALIEEFFRKEEIQHQSGNSTADADKDNGNRWREDEEDDEDDEDDNPLLLKSKKIIDKLIIILKNIKFDYFQSNFIAENSFPSSPAPVGRGTTSGTRPPLLQRQRSTDRLALSRTSSFNGLRQSMRRSSYSNNSRESQTQGKNSLLTFQSTKMKQIQQRLSHIQEIGDKSDEDEDDVRKTKDREKMEEGEEDEEEEEDEANSLDSDMNFISEDILNSMIYTLQYILVIDFLPRRIKWMTLKSLIFEYSPMFFTTHDKSMKTTSTH